MKRVHLSFPCGQRFDAMKPTTAMSRLCSACDTLVHDLSARSEGEASALLASSDGRLCIRYLYDQTGKVWFKDQLAAVTADRPIPASRLVRGKRALAAASAACALAAPILTEACGGAGLGGSPYTEDAGHIAADPHVSSTPDRGAEDEDSGAKGDSASGTSPDASVDGSPEAAAAVFED